MSENATTGDDTEREEIECYLCNGAGEFVGGEICEACGGYGTIWRNVDTGTDDGEVSR